MCREAFNFAETFAIAIRYHNHFNNLLEAGRICAIIVFIFS